MQSYKKEGFWYSNHEPNFPMPIHSDVIDPNKEAIIEALQSIEKKAKQFYFKGWSTCRCCGNHNGSTSFIYNGWEWPSGFMHYITEHNIVPTQAFIKEVLGIDI